MKWIARFIGLIVSIFCNTSGICQPVFNKSHGLYQVPLLITISGKIPNSEIRYTTDGSAPTAQSQLYKGAFMIRETTVLRAAEFLSNSIASEITTSSYIYPNSVLNQPNNPSGYPTHWGDYCEISGKAIADYEMDPELTSDVPFAQKIVTGLYSLPIVSLVTDKGNLFNTNADENTGGIYVFTGAPVGSGIGRGWERPVSFELFGGGEKRDLSVTCALTMHGGHSRLPDKNPKHSFRLKFKSDYGPSKLHYPIFGENEVNKFNSLIIRTMFNESWVCQGNERNKAQLTRDLWARLMQKEMGYPSSNGIFVHLFLNGLYWGVYTISERINDDFCKSHFGGKKEDYDIIKVSESNSGQLLEASDGNLAKWEEMVSLAEKVSDNRFYFKLVGKNVTGEVGDVETLLDVDNFIDYMLINQYGGNEDWDYHNWYAIRNRTRKDLGFQFLCWDSENIFYHTDQNVLDTYYTGCTTHIFKCLMKNNIFLHRYIDRAYKLLVAPNGFLTEKPAVELWDSLYSVISTAIYDESARWGDYRRDVHPYYSKGELYTPSKHYVEERRTMLNEYFPKRSGILIKQLKEKGWYPKTDPPKFMIDGVENVNIDTLTSENTLTLSGPTTILYTTNGTAPVSWTNNASGTRTKTASAYRYPANLMDKFMGYNGWITIQTIGQSFNGWSPTVERSFYINNSTDIVVACDENENSQNSIFDLQGRNRQFSNGHNKGIFIVNGKKVFK